MKSELSDIIHFHGAPALLAGAGVSIDAPSNLLSGGDMMKGIIDKAVLSNHANHFLNLLHPGGYLRFELLIHRLRKYDPRLEVFKCFKDCQSPNLNHYLLAKLLHENHTVVTTNFDNLIEHAYENLKTRSSKPLSTIAYNIEFQRPLPARRNYLWKFHGSFTREGKDISDSIQAEFTKVLTNAHSGKKRFLESVVSSQDIVVVGYSGSDDLDIIPLLSNTPSNKKILWVKHGSVFKDVTETVSQESKHIKSRYHALGLHKLMYEKGRDFIKVIEAPTTAILASFVRGSEVANLCALTESEMPYSFSKRYFEEWTERVKLTELQKHLFTRALFQDETFNPDWNFPPQNIKQGASTTSPQTVRNISLKSPDYKVMLLIGEFNSRGYNVNANLEQWLKELIEIEQSIEEMQVPSLYDIKGCIQYELGQHEGAAKSFYKALAYYEGIHDHENAFMILDALDSRYLLDEDEKGRMYEALNSVGFYPVIWRRKFNEYSSILSPVHSYTALVNELGEHLLEYDQAVRDLLNMKVYSIAMGDVKGERNIDRLLWKLDYYDEGIARDFDE